MSSAEELKTLGNKALQENDLQAAVNYYSQAIDIDSSNHVLYSNRSAAYAKMEKYTEALTDGEKCVELNKSWAKGYSRKGLALAYLGRTKEAEECYKEGLILDPNNQQLKEGLSEVQRQKSQSFNPFGSPEALIKLRNDPRTKDFMNDQSFVAMLQMCQSNPQVMTSLMQSDPRFMTALSVILGIDMETASGDSDMSESNGIHRPEPSYSPPKEYTSKPAPPPAALSPAEEEKEKGNAAYKSKQFDVALGHYDKAIELDPKCMSFYLNKAAVYFEMGELEKCIEQAEKSVEIGRENRADFKQIAKGLARIGNAYLKQDNHELAIKYFQKSLSEHREPTIVRKLQQVENMLKERERKAYIDPAKSDEERKLGNDFFSQGKYPDAIKHYDEAIKRNPDEAKNYCNRAACFIKLGEFTLAEKDCDETLKRDDKFMKAYLRKAQSLKPRDLDKALDVLRKAQEIEPENKEVIDAIQDLRTSKATRMMNTSNMSEEEVKQRAMQDPAVQEILADPGIRMILQQMQEDPKAVSDHLKNPVIAKKIEKLMEVGILQMR